jgi:NAD(P)-dependent dehydrogenase (short-subunit alcohol dehydrogenase family)
MVSVVEDTIMNLDGKSALITGASLGLGRALARQLADAGVKVVLVARNEEPLAKAVAHARAGGGEAHGLAFDVGDKEAIHRLAGAAAAAVGPIDILVHAASTLGPLPMPLLLDLECEALQRVLEVNLLGPFRLTKAIAGSMVLRERGVVLFVSSDAATEAYPRWGAYGVSKAASDHLARSFAAELAAVPALRFLSVDPGEMNTRMHRQALPEADPTTLADPADVAARLVSLIARAS